MSQSRSVIDDQPAIALTVMLVGTGLLGYFIWLLYHESILNFLRYIRLAELYVINFLSFGNYETLLGFIKPAWLGGPAENSGSNFTETQFAITTEVINGFIHWPAALILLSAGIYIMFFSIHGKFKNQYSLEELIKVQSKIWPIIMPIVNFNPAKDNARANGDPLPDRLPMFAEALAPEEWLSFNAIPIVDGLPERDAMRRALVVQLGPRWTGIKDAPPYIRALYAAFALKGVQRRLEADALLGEIALCWTAKTGFALNLKLMQKIDGLIADPEIGGKADTVARQFAWRTTALLGVLRWARSMGGVLAPATFLWLRGEDRTLWYPLNNLGRRSYHAEAAGAMAHFMAEQAAKKPLGIPRIETALVTINQYLANNAVAIPPRVSDNEQS